MKTRIVTTLTLASALIPQLLSGAEETYLAPVTASESAYAQREDTRNNFV